MSQLLLSQSVLTTRQQHSEREEAALKRIAELDARCRDKRPIQRIHALFSFIRVFEASPTSTIVNAGIHKLADIFEVSDNVLRYSVVQVLRQIQSHITILKDADQAALRIMAVLERKVDSQAHVLALLAVDCLLDALINPITVFHAVVRLLYFPELNVRSTAVYVAGRMYKRLDTFQKIGLPVFLARLKDTTWDLQLRLQVARILGYTRLGYQIETKVAELLQSIFCEVSCPTELRLATLYGWVHIRHSVKLSPFSMTSTLATALASVKDTKSKIALLQNLAMMMYQHSLDSQQMMIDMETHHTFIDHLIKALDMIETSGSNIASQLARVLKRRLLDLHEKNTSMQIDEIPQYDTITDLQPGLVVWLSTHQLVELQPQDLVGTICRLIQHTSIEGNSQQLKILKHLLYKLVTTSLQSVPTSDTSFIQLLQLLPSTDGQVFSLLLCTLVRLPHSDTDALMYRCRLVVESIHEMPIKKQAMCLKLLIRMARQLDAPHRYTAVLPVEEIVQVWQKQQSPSAEVAACYWYMYRLGTECGANGQPMLMERLLEPLISRAHSDVVYLWLRVLMMMAKSESSLLTTDGNNADQCAYAARQCLRGIAILQTLRARGHSRIFQLWWLHLRARMLTLSGTLCGLLNDPTASMQKLQETASHLEQLSVQYLGMASFFPRRRRVNQQLDILEQARIACQLLSFIAFYHTSIQRRPRMPVMVAQWLRSSESGSWLHRIGTKFVQAIKQPTTLPTLVRELVTLPIPQEFFDGCQEMNIEMDPIEPPCITHQEMCVFLRISGRVPVSQFPDHTFHLVIVEATLVHTMGVWQAPHEGDYRDWLWGRERYMTGPLGACWSRPGADTHTVPLHCEAELKDSRFECRLAIPSHLNINDAELYLRLSVRDTHGHEWHAVPDRSLHITFNIQ